MGATRVSACPQGHARTRRFAPASVSSWDRTVPVSRDVTHSHHALSRYQVCKDAHRQSRRARRDGCFPTGPRSPAACRGLWCRRKRRGEAPRPADARGRKRKRPEALPRPRPRPAPRRAARRRASSDVSLGGGAVRWNRLGRGQGRVTRSRAEPKRDPEPEQPPPWQVSPAGAALPRRGRIRFPFPSPVRSRARRPALPGPLQNAAGVPDPSRVSPRVPDAAGSPGHCSHSSWAEAFPG